jgi:DNA-binding NarL/FixJ family response regulator
MFKNLAGTPKDIMVRPLARFRAPDGSPMTLKILLVDDNITFMSAVRHFLDRLAGVSIIGQAHDGKTALAQVRENMPDVVLMDIAMPGMNGLELARALRQAPASPRIIFLSMHDNQEYRAAAHELEAGFVSKADFVNELIPKLEAMAQGQPVSMPVPLTRGTWPRGQQP